MAEIQLSKYIRFKPANSNKQDKKSKISCKMRKKQGNKSPAPKTSEAASLGLQTRTKRIKKFHQNIRASKNGKEPSDHKKEEKILGGHK